MNKQELVKEISKIVDTYLRINEEVEKISSCFSINDWDTGLIGEAYSLFDEYLDMKEAELGTGSWISWYIYDNDMGNKSFHAIISGVKMQVDCIEDLVDVILKEKED